MVTFLVKFQIEIIAIRAAGGGVGRRVFFEKFFGKNVSQGAALELAFQGSISSKNGQMFHSCFFENFRETIAIFSRIFLIHSR